MRQGMLMGVKLTMALTALALSACDKIADSSSAAAQITGTALNGAANEWRDALTYHPPAKPAMPQTRYCYKNMDDIVCYDSVQPSLTSKLVGFQDATTISWVQQGGGSLGASGAPPVSYQQADAHSPAPKIIQMRTPIEASPGVTAFHDSGEILTTNLPPRSY